MLSMRRSLVVFSFLLLQTVVIKCIEAADLEESASGENDLATITDQKSLILPKQYPAWYTILRLLLYIGQAFASLCAVIFLYAVFSDANVRNISYNLYLIFLIIPDLLLNFSFMIISIFKVEEDGNFGESWTHALIWFAVFYYTANFWVNFIIAHQIFNLVKKSYQRIKVNPPLSKTVWMQGLCVYFAGSIISTWCSLQVPWSPMSSSANGLFVFQSPEGGVFSKLGSYIFMGTVLLIPTIYVVYVALTMWLKKLLPKSGRTRVISLYFFRILFTFFAFYYPNIVVAVVKSKTSKPSVWFILQIVNRVIEFVSSILTMYIARQKTDIRNAIDQILQNIKLFFCLCCKNDGSSKKKEISHQEESKDGNAMKAVEENKKYSSKKKPEQEVNSKPTPQSLEDNKWDEEDVYEIRRSTAAIVCEEINKVWDDNENERVYGGRVEVNSKPTPQSLEDNKWDEDEVYEIRRSTASIVCEEIDKVWDDDENERVYVGRVEEDTERTDEKHRKVSKDRIIGRNLSLFSKLRDSTKQRIFSDLDSSESLNARSSKVSEINQRSEVTMDSYNSDFRRLNDGFKRLDHEADQMMGYVKDSTISEQSNEAIGETSV